MAACNAEVKNSHAAPIPRVQPRGPFFEPAGNPGGYAALIALKDGELWSIELNIVPLHSSRKRCLTAMLKLDHLRYAYCAVQHMALIR